MFLSRCHGKERVRFWFENFWQEAAFKLYKSIFKGWSLERIGGRRTGRGVGWGLVGRSKVSPPSPLLRRRKPLQKLLPRDNSKSWSNCCIITALKLPSHHHSLHRGDLAAGFSFCILAPPLNTEVFLYSLTKFDGLGGWFHYWGLKFWVLSSINWLIFWGSLSKFLRDLIWVVALFMWRRAY